jgi:hypothetical protein
LQPYEVASLRIRRGKSEIARPSGRRRGNYRLWLSQKASFMESTSGKKAENVAFKPGDLPQKSGWGRTRPAEQTPGAAGSDRYSNLAPNSAIPDLSPLIRVMCPEISSALIFSTR